MRARWRRELDQQERADEQGPLGERFPRERAVHRGQNQLPPSHPVAASGLTRQGQTAVTAASETPSDSAKITSGN